LLHVTVTGGVLGCCIPKVPIRGCLASSATDTASANGFDKVAERATLTGRGPCDAAPPSNLSDGGVFPVVGSVKGETSQRGSRPAGTAMVWPLLTSVQVSLPVPKSLGTVTVKTPHCLPGRK
jgi:hypothetical protein